MHQQDLLPPGTHHQLLRLFLHHQPQRRLCLDRKTHDPILKATVAAARNSSRVLQERLTKNETENCERTKLELTRLSSARFALSLNRPLSPINVALQRERVWEQNEYKRLKKLSHQVALENATRDAEEKDRYEMKTRLEIWDDDESDELFYTDRYDLMVLSYICSSHSRIKWRANRTRQLFSENRADTDSRAIDAAEEERVRRESELFLERQMETIRATQEEQKKAGLLVDDTAPLKISVQVATSKPEKKVEDAPKVVFGQEEDDETVIKKRRVPLIELDFAMDKEKAAEKLESIRTQVTKDKDTLWKAKVRWEAISDVSSELVVLKRI